MALWQQILESGRVVIVDGAMGTELQRRGVPMDTLVWSGGAFRDHEDVIRETHEDYVRAGADVIITNTFGTARHMLAAAGLESAEIVAVNRRACELAIEARDNAATRPVSVAGSITTFMPGADETRRPTAEEERASYREQAEIFAESGCDLIALEMIQDVDHGRLAAEEASRCGLPVWLGIGCRRQEGRLVGFDRTDIATGETLAAALACRPAVVNTMHNEIPDTPAALAAIRAQWPGPVGAYPNAGYFTMPQWHFVEVSPDDYVAHAREWVAAGARLVGGCCGIGPDHIRALAEARDDLV